MGSVTIRIEPQQEPGKTDFDVHLIEEDGNQTSGLLTRAGLTTGRWTANLDAASPPPASDIITLVADAAQNGRNDPRYGEIAETLQGWLLPVGPVRQRWLALNNPRIYVDARLDALERLPWELARAELPPVLRPALINGLYRLSQIARGAAGAPPDIRGSAWPFRILIVIGCTKEEESGLHVGDEVKAIERNFHPLGRTVDVHCMYRPTKTEMLEWITTYHPQVFHFAGHGGRPPGEDKYGLRIESENGVWFWTSDAIDSELLEAQWIPHFVFLNACRSAAELSRRERSPRYAIAGCSGEVN